MPTKTKSLGKGLSALLSDPAPVGTPSLQFIQIKDIVPNPLNPRKEFDQNGIDELTDSILKLGVIQPITVRPKGDKYELICGERRYRAALSVNACHKERNIIPASVRNLTDAEALECMITENLQRKDVHPMEEADAFKMMLDRMNYTIPDIAAKIGKPESFVHRRLQLMKLTPDLLTILQKNELPIGHAELLSRLEEIDQQQWFDKQFNHHNHWNSGPGTLKDLKGWFDTNTNKLLSEAPFDIQLTGLGTIREIACTVCPNNTSVLKGLFPDSPEEAICTFKTCYRDKCLQHMSREVEKALSDPDIILIYDRYGTSDFRDKLLAEGVSVLKQWDDYRLVQKPNLQEDLAELDRDDYDSDEEYQTEVDEVTANYQDDLKEFNENNADVKRAFDIYSGKYTYIKLTSKGVSSSGVSQDVKTSIADLESKRKRGIELDQEKIMKRLVEHMRIVPPMRNEPKLTRIEEDCLIALAFDNNGAGDEIYKLLGLKTSAGGYFSVYDKGHEIVEAIANATHQVRSAIVRKAIYYHYTSINPKALSGGIIFHLAKDWCPGELSQFQTEQFGIRQRREANIDQKITALKKPAETEETING